MSHVTGTVQTVAPALTIGPDSGAPPSSPNTWAHNFSHAPAPGGSKFVILHFRNASLPASNRLEVDLGYDTDVFTSADGVEFWTRPVNIHVLAGGLVPIRYITNGAATGGVVLDKYGRGERHAGEPGHPSISNSDPFLPSSPYVEPTYDPFWFCGATPNWENINCVPGAGNVRKQVAQSVGMIVSVHGEHVSTCSVTLIAPDRIITAGHCVADPAEELFTSSVTFDYATACDGSRPAGYNAKFHKVKNLVKFRNKTIGGTYYDYCVMEIKVPMGGLGLTPVPMRASLPAPGEQIFGVHHPNGASKKLSIPHPGFATVISSSGSGVRVNLDVSGGSSGSGLFDTSGNIVGVLSTGGPCSLSYFPTATILPDLEAPPAPPTQRDVMIVFDRSGSMAMDAGTGRTKIAEARDAASLFVQLVRASTGNRVGLVAFSTTASTPFPLAAVTPANKTALVGPAPFTGGVVGALTPGGATTIGGGLDAARLQFPAPGVNTRAILLLTDGLQNTPPMIASVAGMLSGIDINVIGYGTESSLDGELLTNLANQHNGLYTRAMSPLHLKKFFALAFGNIFEAGSLIDPEYFMPRGENVSKPIPFEVCGEEHITVVVGWDREDALLLARLTSPSGVTVGDGTRGAEQTIGRTWSFLRLALPFGGERDGGWSVEVFRGGGVVVQGFHGGGIREFPTSAVDVNYFVNIIADGGPRLERMTPNRKFYTGDVINPLVALKYDDGTFPPNAKVRLTVSRPDDGVGNILTRSKLGPPATLDADTIPARQATLLTLEQQSGRPVVGFVEETFELFDDAAHDDGTFEPDGVFGNPLQDLLKVEGNYTFHFVAGYGDGCVATRELLWALHVDAGIDPTRSDIRTNITVTRPDGTRDVTVTIVPRDRYGNHIGPGRGGSLSVGGSAGTTVTGPLLDNGDGSYTVQGEWDPASGQQPGVMIGQDGRPPVSIHETAPPLAGGDCKRWKILVWVLLFLSLLLLILLLLKW